MVNHILGTQKIEDVHKMFCLFTRGTEIILQKRNPGKILKFSCPRIHCFEGFAAVLSAPIQCSVSNLVHLMVKPENMRSACFVLCLREIIAEISG